MGKLIANECFNSSIQTSGGTSGRCLCLWAQCLPAPGVDGWSGSSFRLQFFTFCIFLTQLVSVLLPGSMNQLESEINSLVSVALDVTVKIFP